MQPNQNTNNDQFYFMNDNHSPQRNSFSRGNGSMKSRIFVVVGGIIIIIIAAIILNLVLSGSKNANNKNIINLVEDQSIMMQIANQGTTNSKNQSILNLSATTQLSMSSAQSQLIKVSAAKGVPITQPEKNYSSSSVKTSLASSLLNGAFDAAYISNYQTKINQYQNNLSLAYSGESNANMKTLLNTLYKQNKILIDYSKTLQSN